MKRLAWFAGLAALFAAQPALACRGPFSHRYVLLETPPSRLPAGAVLLRVRVARSALFDGQRYAPSAMARITGARDRRLIGQRIHLRPQLFSSCGHWRESERAIHVVGFVSRRGRGLVLTPVVYRSKEYRTPAEDRSEGIERPRNRDGSL